MSNVINGCFSYLLPLKPKTVGPCKKSFFLAQPIYFSRVFGDGRVIPSGFKVRIIANPLVV